MTCAALSDRVKDLSPFESTMLLQVQKPSAEEVWEQLHHRKAELPEIQDCWHKAYLTSQNPNAQVEQHEPSSCDISAGGNCHPYLLNIITAHFCQIEWLANIHGHICQGRWLYISTEFNGHPDPPVEIIIHISSLYCNHHQGAVFPWHSWGKDRQKCLWTPMAQKTKNPQGTYNAQNTQRIL